MKTLVSPQGFEIEGTNDKLLGTGYINNEIDDSAIGDNTVDVEDGGETNISWESRETITDSRGMRQFIDSKANLCWECDLHFIDEEAGITTPQRLFPDVAGKPLPTTVKIPAELDLGQLTDLKDLIERGIDSLRKEAAGDGAEKGSQEASASGAPEVGEMVIEAIGEAMKRLH